MSLGLVWTLETIYLTISQLFFFFGPASQGSSLYISKIFNCHLKGILMQIPPMYLPFLRQSSLKMPDISTSLKSFLYLLHPENVPCFVCSEKLVSREPEQFQGSPIPLPSGSEFSVVCCPMYETIAAYIFLVFQLFTVEQQTRSQLFYYS